VAWLAASLPRAALARLARGASGADEELRAAIAHRFALDLAAFLNRARRADLDAMAQHASVPAAGRIGELRARLWLAGAEREAGGREHLGTPLQPVPIALGGKLVVPARGNGIAPPSPAWPRPVPPPVPLPAPDAEPDTLEELLAAAGALCGARLGAPTRDKGAHGAAIAAALGVAERGASEPDWRGEVEIKTVPVVRDRSTPGATPGGGWWRVKEDPAVSMAGASPLAKLARVLWIARVADGDDAAVLGYYSQEADDRVRRLLARDLHTRPKGGAGATTRGWYVRKRFFADSGFLRSLNG
jgi:hypothetical protein